MFYVKYSEVYTLFNIVVLHSFYFNIKLVIKNIALHYETLRKTINFRRVGGCEDEDDFLSEALTDPRVF